MLDQRLIVVQLEGDPARRQAARRPGVTGKRERLAVGARVHLGRPELVCEGSDFTHTVAEAKDQASPALPQSTVEIAQTVEQERDPRRRAVLARVHGGIEDERARDRPAARDGCGERRLVVEPQIPAQPDERGISRDSPTRT